MANFIRAAFPIWQFIDPTTGLPLNDEYWVSFLMNIFPYLPEPVYHDNQGLIPWNDPIQLNSGGQLPDNLYFNSNLVYRIEVRHGPTENDQLINEINDFIPNGGNINPDSGSGGLENQASNPQFAFINFVSPLSITTAGTHQIAPDWDLVLEGSGTATVTQLISSAAQDKPGTNIPPYALRFAISSGWTSAILQQRFDGLGGIFNNSFISMSVLARSEVGNNNLILKYAPNPPGTPIVIADSPLGLGVGYTPIQGVQPLPVSTNTTQSNLAYIDMQIVLPVNGTTDISDVQIGEQSSLINVPFELLPDETLERQIDHLFHYYQPQINFKPIPSLLTAWDFALNPKQFGISKTITTTPDYIWDQTIAASFSSTLNITAVSTTGDLEITSNVDNQAFYLLQYLQGAEAAKTTFSNLAVNISAYTQLHGGVTAKVYLYYAADGGTIPPLSGSPGTIGTIAADGVFTLDPTTGANWSQITQPEGQSSSSPIQFNFVKGQVDVGFNGFDGRQFFGALPSHSNFAIVVTFLVPTTGTNLIVSSISCVPGDIPTRPAPQTFSECLRDCQFYYEKSYNLSDGPGTATIATTTGAIVCALQPAITGASFNGFSRFLTARYNTRKRITITPAVYSTNGAINSVLMLVYQGPTTVVTVNVAIIGIPGNWTFVDVGETGFNLQPVDRGVQLSAGSPGSPGLPGAEAIALFHWVADARLGKV